MKIVYLVVAVVLAACKPPAPDSSTSAAREQPVTTAPQSDLGTDSGLEFTGEPVAVAPMQVLHQTEGMTLFEQRWRSADDAGTAWLVRVEKSATVKVASSPDVVPFSKLFPSDEGPWAAVNGGFYEEIPTTNKFRPMGLVITDGKETSPRRRRGGSGIFVVDAGGARVVHRNDLEPGAEQALQSIDRLVDKGASVVAQRPNRPHAMRSAVAVSDDAVWLVVLASADDIKLVAGGVQLTRSGAGIPLWAFAEYVLDQTDATSALNLDGGVSTQLAVRDGEYRFDVRGVRGTINAVVVRP